MRSNYSFMSVVLVHNFFASEIHLSYQMHHTDVFLFTCNSFHSSHFQTCSRPHLRDQGHACRRLALTFKHQFRRFEFLELH